MRLVGDVTIRRLEWWLQDCLARRLFDARRLRGLESWELKFGARRALRGLAFGLMLQVLGVGWIAVARFIGVVRMRWAWWEESKAR